MGKVKELYGTIQDMLLNGYDHEDISNILGVTREDVRNVDKTMDDALEAAYDSPERWEL
jgi:hypothetical protein